MTIFPRNDYVLVRFIPKNERTAGGLFIPASAQSDDGRAEVLAVGPGRLVDGRRIPIPVKIGDVVRIDATATRDRAAIYGLHEDMYIVREDRLLCVEG